MGFLAALVPLLAGITTPLKDWFKYKQDVTKAEQDYKLATIKAQADAVRQESVSSSADLKERLGATSQYFKQTTFWFLCMPIVYTMFFPKEAATMWANFTLVPDFMQWLFMAVYSSIWGIPVIKGGYGAITDLLQSRREFKLSKTQIQGDTQVSLAKCSLNEKVLADEIRKALFSRDGMTQAQWDGILGAVKKSIDN